MGERGVGLRVLGGAPVAQGEVGRGEVVALVLVDDGEVAGGWAGLAVVGRAERGHGQLPGRDGCPRRGEELGGTAVAELSER